MIFEIFIFLIALVTVLSSTNFISKSISYITHSIGIPEYLASTIVLSFTISLPLFLITIFSNIYNIPQFGTYILIGYAIAMISLIMGIFLLKTKTPIEYKKYRNSTFVWISSLLFLIIANDGLIDRMDGIFMISLFLFYLIYIMYRTEKAKSYIYLKIKPFNIILFPIAVFSLLVGSYIVVKYGEILIQIFEFKYILFTTGILGTIFALPSLDIIKNIFKSSQLTFDNLMGNVIVTLTLIPGVNALINPTPYWSPTRIELIPLIVLNLICLIFAIFTKAKKRISKRIGTFLIILYLLFLAYLIF